MALSGYMFTVVILINVVFNSSGQSHSDQITAPSYFRLKKDEVKIGCQPLANRYSQVNNIDLKKTTSKSSIKPLVAVRYDRMLGSITTWTDADLQSRATVTGNVDSPSQAQLSIVIPANETGCSDEGVYTCFISGDNIDIGVLTDTISKNVTVIAEPYRMEQMTAIPSPPSGGQYEIGTNVTFSCTGTVGSYANPLSIVWCIESHTDNASALATDVKITQTEPQPVGTCQYQRTSTMVYTVLNTDISTKFTCQITAPGGNGTCGVGTVKSTLNIESVSLPGTTTEDFNELLSDSTTQVPSVTSVATYLIAAIVGGAVVGAVGFIACAVSVVLMRRKNVKEEQRPQALHSDIITNTTESLHYRNESQGDSELNANGSIVEDGKSKYYETLHRYELGTDYEEPHVNTDYEDPPDSIVEDGKSKYYETLHRYELGTDYEEPHVNTDFEDPPDMQ